jgi:hypothetical protein
MHTSGAVISVAAIFAGLWLFLAHPYGETVSATAGAFLVLFGFLFGLTSLARGKKPRVMMSRCRYCGSARPRADGFCPTCDRYSSGEAWVCSSCGHNNPVDSNFCGGCGQPVLSDRTQVY